MTQKVDLLVKKRGLLKRKVVVNQEVVLQNWLTDREKQHFEDDDHDDNDGDDDGFYDDATISSIDVSIEEISNVAQSQQTFNKSIIT